jgi:hypothetical protein
LKIIGNTPKEIKKTDQEVKIDINKSQIQIYIGYYLKIVFKIFMGLLLEKYSKKKEKILNKLSKSIDNTPLLLYS